MQEARLKELFASGNAKKGIAFEKARRPSRDVYRMLVQEGGGTPDYYEAWLSQTLLDTLVGKRLGE